ncbi:monocarboxylate transporter 12-like [Patiria miniata]|uniref:Major facilitator superfamily (MFS) profile domain-containing protein n=1 Tax=Patiria miniata TaxID=46514 RepID=A0A913ZG34_PATMI|nr:monocarboxylate transporter 12-like [Patiria miniata]
MPTVQRLVSITLVSFLFAYIDDVICPFLYACVILGQSVQQLIGEIMAKASKLQARRQVTRVSKQNECGWGIVVLIAAHVGMASTGILRCIGILYLPWMNEFDASAKETAAIQSFMSSPACFAVLIGGVLSNRFGCRFTGILGGFLMWLGLFCTYWVNDIVQLYATAVIIGIGMGILMNASSVIITFYFIKRFNVANAVTYAGRGMGTMAIPPLFQLLLDTYGWRGACLVISAIMANMILCGVLFRHRQLGHELNITESSTSSQEELRQQPSGEKGNDADDNDYTDGRTGRVADETGSFSTATPVRYANTSSGDKTWYNRSGRSVVKILKRLLDEIGLNIMRKSLRFSLVCVISLLYSYGYVAFPMFLITRAQTIDVAPSSAASLMSILGIGSLIGSLGNAPMIGWKISAEHVMAICAGLAGIACLLVTADGYAYLAVASFIYGFASGAFFAISIVLCRSFVGVQHFGLGVGLIYVFGGTGYLLGPVISGWIFDATRSYVAVFYMLTGVHFSCALKCLLLPLLKRIEPGLEPKVSDE